MDSLLLDTNLLVLLVVGATSRALIAKHKLLRAFSETDFDLLLQFIEAAADVIVTPNTLTETSNLIGQIGEPARTAIYVEFSSLIRSATEAYVSSKDGAERGEFIRIGLTDCVLLEASAPSRLLLTSDFDLYASAARLGRKVVNFNHVREAGGRLSH